MNIVDAYRRTGSFRAAAAICGVNHRTVRRVVERARRGRFDRAPAPRRARNTDVVIALIESTTAVFRLRTRWRRVDTVAEGEDALDSYVDDVRAVHRGGRPPHHHWAVGAPPASSHRRFVLCDGCRPPIARCWRSMPGARPAAQPCHCS